jgi:hypothetical protein
MTLFFLSRILDMHFMQFFNSVNPSLIRVLKSHITQKESKAFSSGLKKDDDASPMISNIRIRGWFIIECSEGHFSRCPWTSISPR